MTRIVVLGGYGLFGSRISQRLAADGRFQVIVAGRRPRQATDLIAECNSRDRMQAAELDTQAIEFPTRLAALRPDIVIDTAGPFQGRELRVPRAALAAGAHCIDLADGRDYVRRITVLDEEARTAGKLIVSGASSVPGLSAAVVAAWRPRFSRLKSVEAGISPGNRTPRGLATTEAILAYVGQPYRLLRGGEWRTVHGWQSLRRMNFPGVGPRWFARCEVPDLDVLPARWPELASCDFRAGLELHRMHFGLWLASWAVRAGALRSMRPLAHRLLSISEHWLGQGSDTGVMHVELRGTGLDGRALGLRWQLIAQDGDGPQIPATAAVLLAGKLADASLTASGARPCLDLFTLDEFMASLDPYAIRASVRELPNRA